MFVSPAATPEVPYVGPMTAARVPVTAAGLAEMVGRLTEDGCTGSDDAERITQIRLLETLKSVASAVQAQLTVAFAASREAELARVATESIRDRARRDVGAQIGLARRVSPRAGARLVGLATILTGEMPHLMGALRRGRLDEYQALLVAGETATLSREHRQLVDSGLAARYGSMTPTQARGAAAGMGYALDPEQAVRRAAKAHSDRRVSLRPAPDTMTYLTALLPVVDGVAVLAALSRHAASATARGDVRGKGALMADELVARLVRPGARSADASGGGQEVTDTRTVGAGGDGDKLGDNGVPESGASPTANLPGVPAGVDIEIQLVMTDRTLLDGDMEPAILSGHGPIPAPLARHLIRGADPHTTTWVRRLYTDPDTRELTGADARRRLFSRAARKFLVARDQVCRTPWCGAPIQHADHTTPYADGGATDITNGAGLCAACNQTKEHPGWISETVDGTTILITTPTGHRYRSRPPEAPRSPPWVTRVA